MINLQAAEQLLRGNGWLGQLARGWKNRFPAATSAVRQALWRSRRGAEIRRYFGAHPIAKVQIGTGPSVLPGWLNTDLEPSLPGVVFLDATEPLPLANESVDYMYSEHMIEHIGYAEGTTFLRECFRALKPGGQFRVATPNLLNLLRIYNDSSDPAVLVVPELGAIPRPPGRRIPPVRGAQSLRPIVGSSIHLRSRHDAGLVEIRRVRERAAV